MKIGVIPESLLESILLRMGIVPTPAADRMSMLLARALMAGVRLGVFEALADGALGAEEVAALCGTNPAATDKLLRTLTACDYLRLRDARYTLAPVARKWLLKAGPRSLRDWMLFGPFEWEMIAHCEEYVRTGSALDLHRTLKDPEQWASYQRAMRSIASLGAPEVARRMGVPKGAKTMLDIGGSHGYFSVALCRRYPGLRAEVLDLPEAVAQAAPILAAEQMGERVVHRVGNALEDDLGTEAWDVVLIASLVHHFSASANRSLAERVARALRPGGIFAVFDLIRPAGPNEAGQFASLMDLYFAITSDAGTWSIAEIADWQRAAGLLPRRPLWMHTARGAALQVAVKPPA